MKKRIIAAILLLALAFGSTISCETEKTEEEKNKAMNALTNFPLTIDSRTGFDESFDTANLPKIGCTEYTIEFAKNVFEILLYSEEGRSISSHIAYPRKSNTKDKLEVSLKDGSIDIAYIEMTKEEQSFDEELDYTLIGLYPMVFITAAENPVSSIPSDKLNDLFINGEIKNWSDLGGNDGEIQFIYDVDGDSSGYNTYNTLNRILFPGKTLNIDLKNIYELYYFDETVSYDDLEIPYYSYYSYSKDGNYTLAVENPYQIFGLMSANIGFDDNSFKPVYIDGIKPTYESVKNGDYPYMLYTYAATRKEEENSNIKSLLDWIVNEEISDSNSVDNINSTSAKASIGFNRITMDCLGMTREEIVRLLNHYRPGVDIDTHVIPYDELKYSVYQEWLSLVE